MMVQRHSDSLGNRIQFESVQCRQKKTCHTNRIHICILLRQPLSFAVFYNKTHIKVRIMGHHDSSCTKFKELRKYCLNIRCIHNHGIINTCQLFNSVWNRYLWIHKRRKTVCDHTIFDSHSTNLYNLTCKRRKSCCLNIKYNKFTINRLSLTVGNNAFHIINKICFHTIQDFKI